MQGVSIYFSSAAFSIDGIPYSGIPIFVRSETMAIEYLPTEYCIYLANVRAEARSPKTWRAYAYVLGPFLRYMEARGFSWQDPTEEYLAHYRNELEKRRIKRGRIKRVMSRICHFYEWMHRKSWIGRLPFSYETVMAMNRGMLAHVAKSRLKSRSVLVPSRGDRRSERHPRYFRADELKTLFEALAGNERDTLIVMWALFTGIREFELCALRLSQIPPQSAYGALRFYAIQLLEDKGSKQGDLYVPTWLLDRTYRYAALFDRREMVTLVRARGKDPSDHIFLTRRGSGIRPRTVYQLFADLLESTRLTGTFKDLRDTYAINSLDALMKSKEHRSADGSNALLTLRVLMRHESTATTERYLRARKFYGDIIDSDLWTLPDL